MIKLNLQHPLSLPGPPVAGTVPSSAVLLRPPGSFPSTLLCGLGPLPSGTHFLPLLMPPAVDPCSASSAWDRGSG